MDESESGYTHRDVQNIEGGNSGCQEEESRPAGVSTVSELEFTRLMTGQ